MPIDPTTIASDLLDALQAFDREIAPLGLYASQDLAADVKAKPRKYTPVKAARRTEEWGRCIVPLLQSCGVSVTERYLSPWALVTVPDFGYMQLHLVKISKIKVRKFGSRYRVDKHENYAERWAELRMDRLLSDLWSPSALADSTIRLRALLLIGFDKSDDPFRRELIQLREDIDWEKHDAELESRAWADRYERGFNIRLAAWTRHVP